MQMRRKLISVRVNPKILKIAKETGLNVSKACENGLKQQIQREALSKLAENGIMTPDRASQPISMVRPPGFEPGIAGLEGLHQVSVSYQARPQPHIQPTAN
jgi:post-segregation antitoxin (ccd killing protein)